MSNYKHGGYDHKYIVTKRSGKLVSPEAKYFVLRLDKDPHALKALEAYQQSVKEDNLELAEDLLIIINKNRGMQSRRTVKETE